MEEYLQLMRYIYAYSIRELTDKANALLIKKEDIVNIVHINDCFYLVYYGEQSN